MNWIQRNISIKNGSVVFFVFLFIYNPCKLILTKLMDKCYKLNPTFQVCYGFHQLLVNIFIYIFRYPRQFQSCLWWHLWFSIIWNNFLCVSDVSQFDREIMWWFEFRVKCGGLHIASSLYAISKFYLIQ